MNKIFIIFLLISCCSTILVNCTRPAECELPRKVGPCRGLFLSFHFNPSSGECEEFGYGGCDGNENRFTTKEECIERCASGTRNNE